MKLSVGETSKLLGISARTLRYYDEIGLVKPTEITDAGYRYYDDEALAKLQQVMFYRELEFSLKEISCIFSNPQYNKQNALQSQREFLVLKQKHIDELISIIDSVTGGKRNMEERANITADDIIHAKKKYADETRSLWGNTSEYRESIQKFSTYSNQDTALIAEEANKIFAEFAQRRANSPEDKEIQELVSKWQQHISKYYYKCSNHVLSGLGEMYVNDERFTKSIDQFGAGTAKLMSDAIKIYCKS